MAHNFVTIIARNFLEIMAHVKAGGTSKNLRDSQPQYRGINFRRSKGQSGVYYRPAKRGQSLGRRKCPDGQRLHSFFLKEGLVKFTNKRKTRFDGTIKRVTVSSVAPINFLNSLSLAKSNFDRSLPFRRPGGGLRRPTIRSKFFFRRALLNLAPFTPPKHQE